MRSANLLQRLSRTALAGLLALAALQVAIARPASAEIGSYLVFDLASGRVIDARDPHTRWFPASLTKMMTAYVVFHAIRDGEVKPSSPVRISPHAFAQPPSKMGFKVGTVLRIDAALKLIMTKSANDVSVALAEAVWGTEAAFVDQMNRRAADLGMTQTRFANPHGLPNRSMHTSARDMGLLVVALKREFPEYADYFDMTGVKLGGRIYRNHNRLVTQYPGTTGMKTGFICSSGFNLAASARRNGREIVAIVLGGYTSRERNERTAEYLEIGFRRAEAGLLDPQAPTLDRFLPGPRDVLAQPVDLRPIVCGPVKPRTPYDEGVANQMAAATAPGETSDEDQDGAATLVSAYADPDGGEIPGLAQIEAVTAGAAFGTGLGKPVSYLRPVSGVAPPVEISLGGADKSRPNPRSGTIVGGGPPPLPRFRPTEIEIALSDPADLDTVLSIAEEVRRNVGDAALEEGPYRTTPAVAGVRTFHRSVNGIPLPPFRP